MPPPDFSLEFIKDQSALGRLAGTLENLPCFALDIETSEWWNRQRERVALIQIAFRRQAQIKVAVIDALAPLDLEVLRPPLESESTVKIIHNAAFDATKLAAHYGFQTASVFDTMLAARRAGEKRYSLKAQAEIHLGIHLDKSARTSDWSLRPLVHRQLYYAARDPFAALLLSEHQQARKLDGRYFSKSSAAHRQNTLPLGESFSDQGATADSSPSFAPTAPITTEVSTATEVPTAPVEELSDAAIALLGIIAELPTRYSPERLAASLNAASRVGLAGWIIDRRLGKDREIDENSIKLTIAELIDKQLIEVTPSRRLEATEEGDRLWRERHKNS